MAAKWKRRKSKTSENNIDKKGTHTYHIFIPFTEQRYTIKQVSQHILVKDFQERIEITCGIPRNMQRLHYLDACELDINAELKSYDVVNKATFTLKVWERWENLIKSIYTNDVSMFTSFLKILIKENPNLQKLSHHESTQMAYTSLYLAAHLGRTDIIKILLDSNIDINSTTDLGHTALHAAMANGQYKCIDFLLKNGALGDTKSKQSQYASFIAKLNGYTDSDRHVFMFNWQLRAKKIVPKLSNQKLVMMHQQFDSKYPTWFNGPYGTKYICSTLPPGEYSGTRINAPKNEGELKTNKSDGNCSLPTLNKCSSKQKNVRQSFEYWLECKQEQRILLARKEKEREKIRQIQEAEDEKLRKLQQRKQDNERRFKQPKNETEKYNKRTNIYENYLYQPNYGKSVIPQLMNEISLNESVFR